MADVSNWSANELENLFLDDVNLSDERGGRAAKIMAAVKKCDNASTHKTGNETISGIKTLTDELVIKKGIGTFLRISATDITQGTPPSSGSKNYFIPFEDKNGKRLFYINGILYNTGESKLQFGAVKNTANSTTGALLEVGWNDSAEAYARCPQTKATGQGNDIVTRAFLANRVEGIVSRLEALEAAVFPVDDSEIENNGGGE